MFARPRIGLLRTYPGRRGGSVRGNRGGGGGGGGSGAPRPWCSSSGGAAAGEEVLSRQTLHTPTSFSAPCTLFLQQQHHPSSPADVPAEAPAETPASVVHSMQDSGGSGAGELSSGGGGVTVGVVPPSQQQQQQQQVATQTQVVLEADIKNEIVVGGSPGAQVTAQVVVSSSQHSGVVAGSVVAVAVVPASVSVSGSNHSLSSSPASGASSSGSSGSSAAENSTATAGSNSSGASQQPHYIAVTVSDGSGVVVAADAVAQSVHPAYVQYVDESTPETATIYATTNGQMAYPVYTMGEATATMYTPAASGQYYTPSNQTGATYSQVAASGVPGQSQQIIAQSSGSAYILQQGVDNPETHALIASNRASPPTASAEAAAAVAVSYMVPSAANATPSTVTNNSVPSPLMDGGDSGGSTSLSHATRISPATVQWLMENYETAEGVSLPRSTLFSHYLRHCTEHKLEPVNAASFGKLIRSVFIGLRTRRLGTRGNSKYHYYGIRVKPSSPLNGLEDEDSPVSSSRQTQSSPSKRFKAKNQDYESGQTNNTSSNHAGTTPSPPQLPQHHQYLGEASGAIPMFPEIDFTGEPLPEDCTYEDVDTLRSIYREHCEAFLDAVMTLEFSTVESLWREFWRSSDNNNGDECEEEKYLSKTKLYLLCKCRPVQQFFRKVDFDFYQNLVEVLIPDVLRPIPSSLTQSIRNFAKGLEGWLTGAMNGCPEEIVGIKLCAVSAFAQTLRRYTSLNHLAQAARAVLQNSAQISQMLADLNRVDFHNVQEQASWVCQCDSDVVQRLEADFKATLQQQNSLEQWAAWLKNVVSQVLKPYEGKSNFAKAARQFLLKWSFYSSMVIRDLTLRSAASFGSFHLIRLLYDEYMFYLIEHQVASATGETPIAVIGEKSHPPAFSMMEDDKNLCASSLMGGAGLDGSESSFSGEMQEDMSPQPQHQQINGGTLSMGSGVLQHHLVASGKVVQITPSSTPPSGASSTTSLRSDAAKRLKMS